MHPINKSIFAPVRVSLLLLAYIEYIALNDNPCCILFSFE